MKKIIALLLCAVVLVGVLAGCGKNDSNDGGTETKGTDTGISETEKAGTLVVTANASVIVSYGTDGLVLGVEGANEEGKNLVESYEELLGLSCAEVVSQLIKDSSNRTYLGRLTYVVVKHDKDSGTPGTSFLEGIEAAAKAAVEIVAPSAKLVMITQDMLDADGYIDLKTAKVLVEGFLEVEQVDGFDGTEKPVDGFYSFAVAYNGMEDELHVNASTGCVGEGALDGALQDPEETEPVEDTASTEETGDTQSADETPVGGEPAVPEETEASA